MNRASLNLTAVALLFLFALFGSLHLVWQMLEEQGPKGGEHLGWLLIAFPIPFFVLIVIVGGIVVPLMLSIVLRRSAARFLMMTTAVSVQVFSVFWINNYGDWCFLAGVCRSCSLDLLGCELVIRSYPVVLGLIWLVGLGFNLAIFTDKTLAYDYDSLAGNEL